MGGEKRSEEKGDQLTHWMGGPLYLASLLMFATVVAQSALERAYGCRRSIMFGLFQSREMTAARERVALSV